MQPLDFCNLARRLIDTEKNPEGFRSAISRAYYGAFLPAVDFLGRMPVYLVTKNKHQEILDILAQAGDKDIEMAGVMLGDLRQERNDADYDLANKHVEREAHAERCWSNAIDIISKLNGCRVSSVRFLAVTAAIRVAVAALRGPPPPSSP